jgi:hypothetical protein
MVVETSANLAIAAYRIAFQPTPRMETIDRGSPVVPFWSDRIHQRLRENLRSFER